MIAIAKSVNEWNVVIGRIEGFYSAQAIYSESNYELAKKMYSGRSIEIVGSLRNISDEEKNWLYGYDNCDNKIGEDYLESLVNEFNEFDDKKMVQFALNMLHRIFMNRRKF